MRPRPGKEEKYDLVGDDNAPVDCQSGVTDLERMDGITVCPSMMDDGGLGEQI